LSVDGDTFAENEGRMRLELFYDIVSPWSYLCFETLCRYRHAWQLDLVLRPAFLGGVMKATGNSPPAALPARGVYLLRDLARSSSQFQVPLTFPNEFPTNTIGAMRMLTLVAQESPEQHEALARSLWRRYWGAGKDVVQSESLRAACEAAGVDPTVVELSADDGVKAKLRAATEEAVDRGAFGFPAMFVMDADGEEMYFGSDRISLIAFDRGLTWSGPQGPVM
jgi:glutathione S-transferase kappa 1